jgi:hypothetical protein
LPLGNLDAGSPAYTDVYTVNADKTVTVIAEGWYSISAMLSCSTPPLTDAPTVFGIWTDLTNVTPANPNPLSGLETQHSAASSSSPHHAIAGTIYLQGNVRVGLSVNNGDPTSRSWGTTKFAIVKLGSGPAGPQGPTGATGPAGAGASIPLVSTLPGSPVDGQEVYYQDSQMAAIGAVWHLRYRAASASIYKWELVGGGKLRIYSNAQLNTNQDSLGPSLCHSRVRATTSAAARCT